MSHALQPALPVILVCAMFLVATHDSRPRQATTAVCPERSVLADSLSGHWTNGAIECSSGVTGPGQWMFDGGSVHEGGYSFTVFAKNDSTLVIGNRSWEQERDTLMNEPSFGKRGDRMVLHRINGKRVLIAYSPSGAFRDFLEEEPALFDLATFLRANKTRYQLSGKYLDSATHRVVTFDPDGPTVEGLSAGNHYKFAAPYDFLDDVLIFPKKKAYSYKRTDEGLILKEAIDEGDEEYTAGKRLMSLRQTEWFNLSGDSALKGRYTYASSIILSYDIYECLTPGQRRICRNEIFARHGYRFRTPDMSAYFQSQPWFEPRFESVNDKLTELERLNIQILEATDKD